MYHTPTDTVVISIYDDGSIGKGQEWDFTLHFPAGSMGVGNELDGSLSYTDYNFDPRDLYPYYMDYSFDSAVSVQATPEPSSLALMLAAGIAGLVLARRRWKKPIATFFLALVASTVPLAADTFDFTYAIDVNYDPFDPDIFVLDHGSGTLTATYQGNDTYLVTAIAGVSSLTGAITALAPLGAVNNDNLIFYPGTPYLDTNGIAFFTGRFPVPDVIYFAGGAYQERAIGSGAYYYDSGTFSITRVNAAPEPAPPVASLLLTGLAADLLRRLHRKSETSIRSMPSSSTCV
jgi:hypothetical protein